MNDHVQKYVEKQSPSEQKRPQKKQNKNLGGRRGGECILMSCLWSAWAPEHVVVTSLQPELIHSPSTPPLKSLSGAALLLVMCDSHVELIDFCHHPPRLPAWLDVDGVDSVEIKGLRWQGTFLTVRWWKGPWTGWPVVTLSSERWLRWGVDHGSIC